MPKGGGDVGVGSAQAWSFVRASLLAIGAGVALLVLALSYAFFANVTSMVPLSLAIGLILIGLATFVAVRRGKAAKPSRIAIEAAWYFAISALGYTATGYAAGYLFGV